MGDLPKCGGEKLGEVTNCFAEKWGVDGQNRRAGDG